MRELTPIARIRSDFPGKFGIPRQSGLIDALKAEVVFEPPFRDVNALKGLEGYSHIWLIWQFSESVMEGWSPTVKPPRLGGNRRMGVFATRSPFRPNPLGLSCVRLEGVDPSTPEGPVLHVAGADLLDGTPIYDIKPYLPHADCHPEATGGFSGEVLDYAVEVEKMYQARGGDAMNAAEELAFFLDSFIDLYQNHKDVLRFIRSFETYIRYENVPEEDVRVYNEVVDGFARKFHAVYEKAERDGTLRLELPEKKFFYTIMYIMLSASEKFAEGLVYPSEYEEDMTEELELLKDMILQKYSA